VLPVSVPVTIDPSSADLPILITGTTGFGPDAHPGRVTAVAADIERPKLGLNPRRLDELAGLVHRILHAAASVSISECTSKTRLPARGSSLRASGSCPWMTTSRDSSVSRSRPTLASGPPPTRVASRTRRQATAPARGPAD
jgi:hypothetical protein